MFILLFDIDASISCRCHQYYLALLCVCMLLINCCGFVETTSLKIDASTPKSDPVISPSPVKQQSKPSSVIYIPSLDDVNTVSSIHASEHDIRFEDFFWNGSGDEPLTLSLKSNARLTAVNGFVGRETFIKTATVIATVYIDDSNENGKDPDCDSDKCDTDSNEIPDDYLPVNKHFWLVTRVHGYLNDDDIPQLQQKLADIYRIAFMRQQSLHLGLLNVTVENSDEPIAGGSGAIGNSSFANGSLDTTPIIDNKQSTNSSLPINSTSVLKYEYAIPKPTVSNFQSIVSMIQATLENQTLSDENVNSTTNTTIDTTLTMQANHSEGHRHKRSMSSILPSPIAPIPSNIQQHNSTEILLQSTNAKTQSNFSNTTNSNFKSSHLQNAPIDNVGKTNTKNSTPRGTKKNRNDAIIGHISVLIHNISVISNADRDYLDNLEKEWTNPAQGYNFSSDAVTSADNQTEIIYTVFVNGIPVLATIAANDMKLMSDTEVSKILEKSIFTKAEPYLKEPQATPLIPSSTMTTNQNKPILAMIFQNPYILAFIGALLLLIILLLMILMLITGSKKQRTTTTASGTKRKGVSKAAQTAQQSFLPPVPVSVPHLQPQSNANTTIGHMPSIDESHQFRSNMTSEIPSRHSNTIRQKKQVGTQITSLHDTVDGFACERDHSFIIIPTPLKRKHHKKVGTPTIYFPEPPSSEPSSPSHSQTQSSSSSSSTSDTSSIYYIKKHKNRRSHHLYAKRPKRVASLNHREYATITKKQIERAQKKSKHKRKYLKSGNGNRIGAFEETVQVHSSRSSSTAGKTERQQKQPDECRQIRNSSGGGGVRNMETIPNGSDDTFEMSTGKDSNVYEHIEAFNPMIGKRKNLHNQIISMKQMNNDETKTIISNESEKRVSSNAHRDGKRQNKNDTVNHTKNEMTAFRTRSAYDRSKKATDNKPAKESNRSSDDSRKIQMDRLSNQLSNDEVHTANDDLSIGSFLSMASIRSFPKCNVPEPLSRVLEPAKDTQLDQYDEIEATAAATIASKLPRIVDAKAKNPPPKLQQKQQQQQHEPTTTMPMDKKNDEIVYLTRTRSDGADPGVIGPIAWQYHKKRLEEQERAKLHRDPLYTQHRYEDLLEGAISLYSIETTEYHTIETITKEEFPEILIGKDVRGKSADMYNPNSTSVTKSSPKPYRPFTAMMAPKTAPEEPLITSKGAWTGSTIRPTSGDKSVENPSPNQLNPPQNKPE
ncbi:uncharacterized protein LOC116345954 isoform X2 [Contarinia nasturtii]|uniref:uncharacterized protein LOC116345954 isoform X2 n=1 Tax=Contarinia nasturtii TaxID=265458 RepID=UPI0012D3D453|nr:uncharacterized protein LOC116345954 isoform X2 [Contarinia nasturtii]